MHLNITGVWVGCINKVIHPVAVYSNARPIASVPREKVVTARRVASVPREEGVVARQTAPIPREEVVIARRVAFIPREKVINNAPFVYAGAT